MIRWSSRFLALSILFSAPLVAQANAKLALIKLPPGFKIEVFTAEVPGARSMTLSPNGTLFVGSRSAGKVYAIPDAGRTTKAAQVLSLAEGLTEPNGVAFRDGSLYVAEISRILRYDGIETKLKGDPDQLRKIKPAVVTEKFPTDRHHGWKFIAFGPDGWLYVPVGAPCNVCEKKDERYSTIMRMKPDGKELQVFASGVRNSVGFAWHPVTKELWFTDNGRDLLGDNIPPDELNHAPKKGMSFGFPYCLGNGQPDPEFGKGKDCSKYVAPVQQLAPHTASLGMRFYQGKMFPSEYKNQIFIAEHGSWNRTAPIGYRVTRIRLNGNKAVEYQAFAEGWLQKDAVWGRPVDVQELPDGSLLVSDDMAGAIYRISMVSSKAP